ncbi:AraC family transcriptional regulator [Aquitalea sp.]|uniref:AraC family transcriptional regulator n=1 Tax=Aquitalea sp. TaxID=1872623 RepID=UPI00258A29B8|nr:AraC family transcriptional regulator [Aquitalea sp.]
MRTCTDRLDALLHHFPVRARLFHSGALCGVTRFTAPEHGGQLHLIQAGKLDVVHAGQDTLHICEPSLLFYPRPLARNFVSDSQHGATLACAQLQFEGGADNPLAGAMPDTICVPLKDIPGAEAILGLLFAEAFSNYCGREALLDRLFEAVFIQLLRYLMESGQLEGGMLAGMSHPRLRRALVAMHDQPAAPWTLDELARLCGMSRSVFAGSFRNTLGCTPGVYLQGWRISLAQQMLRKGQQLKLIADRVGYGSEAALSRAFKAHSGQTPRAWKLAQENPPMTADDLAGHTNQVT